LPLTLEDNVARTLTVFSGSSHGQSQSRKTVAVNFSSIPTGWICIVLDHCSWSAGQDFTSNRTSNVTLKHVLPQIGLRSVVCEHK